MASDIGAVAVGGVLVLAGQFLGKAWDAVYHRRELRARLDSSIFRAGLKLQGNTQCAITAMSCCNRFAHTPGCHGKS